MPNRSTTSSTTGDDVHRPSSAVGCTPTDAATAPTAFAEEQRTTDGGQRTADSGPATDPAVPALFPAHLTAAQQAALLAALLNGASRTGACRKLGVSLSAVAETAEANSAFRAMLREVQDALSHNVATALYRQALKGSIPAQTAYLKFRPPAEWRDDPSTSGPATFDEIYDSLDSREIRQLCRAMAVVLSPEAQRALDSGRDEELPGGVPE
ncbi:MAG: hypothetical protein WD069_17110 [Planctomycetales bacterium]